MEGGVGLKALSVKGCQNSCLVVWGRAEGKGLKALSLKECQNITDEALQ